MFLETTIVIGVIVQTASVLFTIENFVSFWSSTRHQLLIYHLATHCADQRLLREADTLLCHL